VSVECEVCILIKMEVSDKIIIETRTNSLQLVWSLTVTLRLELTVKCAKFRLKISLDYLCRSLRRSRAAPETR
jgi:hypothetical protein